MPVDSLPAHATPDSHRLFALGQRVLAPFVRLGAKCAMITGSTTEGLADRFSDLDTTVYYDAFPTNDDLAAARRAAGGSDLTRQIGQPSDGGFMQEFIVDGVDCQIGFATLAQWESDIRSVLDGKDLASPNHKAMSGTLSSMAVHGEKLLENWKQRLREYPDSLARAMVEHHLKFFGIWRWTDRMKTRDAHLWIRQTLLDSSFNVLGVLAGLNRKYFTTFQFKRTKSFVNSFKTAPPDLYDRLEALWKAKPINATRLLKSLVADTTGLVEKHMPAVDTKAVRKSLSY